MIHDMNQFGLHIKPKATTTLKNMRKADLIEYIRTLEHNYNVAVTFNEQQARNCEALLKEYVKVVRCKDCVYGRKDPTSDVIINCGFLGKNMLQNCFCGWGEKRDCGSEDICKTTNLPCIKCNPGPCEHRGKENE